jgi:hypothetical protein
MNWLDPFHGNSYAFWSGIGNDLPIWLAGFVPMWWMHHKCHVAGCWRRGKYPFRHYRLCGRHHPDVPSKVTHLHISQLNKKEQ